MRHMSKERRDLPLSILNGAGGAELRIRPNRLEEGGACVEALPGAASRGLISNPVEEIIRHYVANYDSVASSGRATETWPRTAAIAAISVTRAAVAELAAA